MAMKRTQQRQASGIIERDDTVNSILSVWVIYITEKVFSLYHRRKDFTYLLYIASLYIQTQCPLKQSHTFHILIRV